MNKSEATRPSRHPAIEPRSLDCVVPLTAMQSVVWRYYAKESAPLSTRMCAGAVRVSGPLDRGLLRHSIERVVERHEALRTRIDPGNGAPTQRIDAARPYELETVDLSALSPITAVEEARRNVQEFLRQKIDLTIGPVLGARLLRLSANDHVLALALDHIVGDATSNGILSREIWEAYAHSAGGSPFLFPARPLQFADYAIWEQQTERDWQTTHEPYWRAHLDGAPSVQIPLGHDSSDAQDPASAVVHIPFGQSLSAGLRGVARAERALLPLVVLTPYAVVVASLCRQWDLTAAFPTHGRHGRPELANMIGFLASILFLRVEITAEVSLVELVRRLQSDFDAASEHADFGRVLTLVAGLKTELGFNWLPSKTTRRGSDHQEIANAGVRLQPFAFRSLQPVKFAPFFYDNGVSIGVSVHFRPDLVSRERITRLGRSLVSVADELVQRPWSLARSVAQRIESSG